MSDNSVNSLFKSAYDLQMAGKLEQALEAYQRTLDVDPKFVNAHNNRGNIFFTLKRFSEAVEEYNKAIAINPQQISAYVNKGVLHFNAREYEQSKKYYQHALDLDPNYVESHSKMGAIEYELGNYDAAFAHFQKALELAPDHAETQFNLSLLMLTHNNYDGAWELYENRRVIHAKNHKSIPGQQWSGEDLHGKVIYLYGEQGFGDSLQFCRYISLIHERGAKIYLNVSAPLRTLLYQSFPYIEMVESRNNIQYDYYCSLMSIPRVLTHSEESIPHDTPYLKATPDSIEKWRGILGGNKIKIGIALNGSTLNVNDKLRSIPVDLFLSHFGDVDKNLVDFICLQKEPLFSLAKISQVINTSDNEISFNAKMKSQYEICQRHGILYLGDRIENFNDTAGILENIDLLISVDTSVAHAAGALNKLAWIFIPFRPDFRWLLNRNDSPWYKSVTLFRQKNIREWEPVLRAMREELDNWLNHHINAMPPALSSKISENSAKDFADGISLLNNKKYFEALASLSRCLGGENNPDLYYHLALCYEKIGSLELAVSYYRKAIQHKADYASAYLALATILYTQAQYQSAFFNYAHYLKHHPQDKKMYSQKYYDLGINAIDSHIARKYLNFAIELDSENELAYLKKLALEKKSGIYSRIEETAQKLLLLSPNNSSYHLEHSYAKLIREDLSGLYEYYALNKQPSFANTPLNGKTLLIKNTASIADFMRNFRFISELSKRSKNIYISVPENILFLQTYLDDCFTLVSNDTDIEYDYHYDIHELFLLADANLVSLATIPEAGLNNIAVKKSDSDKPKVALAFFSTKSVELLKLIENDKIDWIELAKDSLNVELINQLCDCDLVIGDNEDILCLSAALKIPSWLILPEQHHWSWFLNRQDSPWYLTMRLYRKTLTNDYDEIIGQIKKDIQYKFLKQLSSFTMILPQSLQQAEQLRKSGQLDSAIEHYLSLLKSDESNAQLLFLLGDCYLSKGDVASAENYLQKSLEIEIRNASALNLMASIFIMRNDFDKALEHTQAALILKPQEADIFYNHALALQNKERYFEAIAYYDVTLMIEPQRVSAVHNKGNVLLSLQRYPEALACYEQVLTINPAHENAKKTRDSLRNALNMA